MGFLITLIGKIIARNSASGVWHSADLSSLSSSKYSEVFFIHCLRPGKTFVMVNLFGKLTTPPTVVGLAC